MSEALTDKYRPKSFDEVVGHKAAINSLRNALKRRSAKTFLFVGPSGLGKTTLARIAAKELGCLSQDLLEIDAATHTGIEDMRGVTSQLMYKPLGEGKIKGLIVDEFHALSKPAVQSLLKMLEEPPDWVYWFIATTEPTKILPTIKTRSFVVDLKPLSADDLTTLLEDIAKKEKLFDGPQGDKIIDLCVKEAHGSARQAIANFAVCSVAKTTAEAAELLRSAENSAEAIELARALFRGAGWNEVQGLLGKLKEINPESVRHIIRAYSTTVILNAKTEKQAGRGLEILDAFSQPFNSFDGISPLVLACGKAVLS